jgi:hypothetical protein
VVIRQRRRYSAALILREGERISLDFGNGMSDQ